MKTLLLDASKNRNQRVFRAAVLKVSFIIAVLLAIVAPATALAHAGLRTSVPANGATVEGPVSEVRLRFSNPVEPTYTTVTITGASAEQQAQAKAVPGTGAREVSFAVGELDPGSYVVRWRAAARDGHVISGRFSFSVQPAKRPAEETAASRQDPAETMNDPAIPVSDQLYSTALEDTQAPDVAQVDENQMANSEPLSVAAPEAVAIRWVAVVAGLGLLGTLSFVWLFLRSRRSAAP